MTTATQALHDFDMRQRFYFEQSPVRGDVVRIKDSLQTILQQKDYPVALQKLLGEMLVAASLLIGTLKIEGRLSIQLQNSGAAADTEEDSLTWAMAECDHQGHIRGLAEWTGAWQSAQTANDAFAKLGKVGEGVLFINIQPDATYGTQAEGYQGIVERVADNLADCLAHYQQQSVQIPTLINLACDGEQAGGIVLQLLPRTTEEEYETVDNDLFPRLKILTKTLKAEELTTLPADEILYRLYHEENIVAPEPVSLTFGCTCSREKCEMAIEQIGQAEALDIVAEQNGTFEMDCGFCGEIYKFNNDEIAAIFTE